MITYTCATDGASFTNMNAVDSKIYLTVGCIQIIFVNKFVSTILVSQNISSDICELTHSTWF